MRALPLIGACASRTFITAQVRSCPGCAEGWSAVWYGTNQVPLVASDVEEHGDLAVLLHARDRHERSARGCHPGIGSIEILHMEEETYPASHLPAHG
jgi:hypothetical protein